MYSYRMKVQTDFPWHRQILCTLFALCSRAKDISKSVHVSLFIGKYIIQANKDLSLIKDCFRMDSTK